MVVQRKMIDGKNDVDELYPLVYAELRRIATSLRPSHSVTPTVLVHEAYLKLARSDIEDWSEIKVRAVAAKAMRNILIDRARRRTADKRGGGWQQVTLSGLKDQANIDLLALSEALETLEKQDALSLQIVELHFFGGLSFPDIARITERSLRTIERRWRAARALLRHLLSH